MNHFTSEQELIDTKSNHRFTRILVMKFSIILFSHSFVWWPFFSSESESNILFLYWLFFSHLFMSPALLPRQGFIFCRKQESCLCTVAAPSRHVSKPSQFIHAEFCNKYEMWTPKTFVVIVIKVLRSRPVDWEARGGGDEVRSAEY